MGEEREFRMPGMTVEPMPEGRFEIRRTPGAAMVFSSGRSATSSWHPQHRPRRLLRHHGRHPRHQGARRSPLGLKGGDVVLTVDGRKPSSPSSLIRILRSYDENETFKLEVLRQKKKETLTAKLGAPRREE